MGWCFWKHSRNGVHRKTWLERYTASGHVYSEGWQTTDSTRCSSLLNTGQFPETVVVWLDRYLHLEYIITGLGMGWVGSG